jgi:hypothetical protein
MVDVNIGSEKLKQLAERIAKVRAHCPEDHAAARPRNHLQAGT